APTWRGGRGRAGGTGGRPGRWGGAVPGWIDGREKLGFVERAPDEDDRRKVLVKVREDKIGPIARPFEPLARRMQALLASYSREELKLLLDFAERSGEIVQSRVAELNDEK